MKRMTFFTMVLLVIFASCKDTDRNTTNEQPSSDIDAAREFIRAALDGDYSKAKTFVVNDSLNQQDIEASERLYKERMSAEDKAKYRGLRFIFMKQDRSTTRPASFTIPIRSGTKRIP